ncbi:MAG: hypothetical protein ACXWNJ_09315 [Vulcanimicrobiaceae bacterium]
MKIIFIFYSAGTGAHGYFEAYGTVGNEPATRYTRAKVLVEAGRHRRMQSKALELPRTRGYRQNTGARSHSLASF